MRMARSSYQLQKLSMTNLKMVFMGRELFLCRHFAEFHRGATTIAVFPFITLDGADVAPVIDVVQIAVQVTVYLHDQQELTARQQPSGQAHRAIEQFLVLEKHACAVVLNERVD